MPYEAHVIDFGMNEQTTPEFLSLNPNGTACSRLAGGNPQIAKADGGAPVQARIAASRNIAR